jgi:hypothetical protein
VFSQAVPGLAAVSTNTIAGRETMIPDTAALAGRRVKGVQAQALDAELTALQGQVKQLRAENARLLRLLELTPQQARPPGPAQAGFFDTAPGAVHAGSTPAERWRSSRRCSPPGPMCMPSAGRMQIGKSGWMPAVWRVARGI